MIKFISYHARLSFLMKQLLVDKQALQMDEQSFELDSLADFLFSGKMLRGSLVVNIYCYLTNGSPSSDVLLAAVAIELIGSALLVHDDIMDQAQFRRGFLTIHKQFEKKFKVNLSTAAVQYGQNMGICVGDYLIFWAYELLAGISNYSQMQKIFSIFSHQLTTTALGQMYDLDLAKLDIHTVTQAQILTVCQNKTANYTACLPLMIGAVLANQPESVIIQFNFIGVKIGQIFQIVDDRLGVLGNQEHTGKIVGADVQEGKKTLYYYYLYHLATKTDRNIINNLFGKQELTLAELNKIQDLIKKYQVDEKVKQILNELADQATNLITALNCENKVKQFLKDFIKSLLKREK